MLVLTPWSQSTKLLYSTPGCTGMGNPTMSGVQLPLWENLSQYITSHPGQLSLAIRPWIGSMSTSDDYGHRYGRKWRVLRNSSPCEQD